MMGGTAGEDSPCPNGSRDAFVETGDFFVEIGRIVKIVEEYGERAVPYVKEYVGNMKNVLKKGL